MLRGVTLLVTIFFIFTTMSSLLSMSEKPGDNDCALGAPSEFTEKFLVSFHIHWDFHMCRSIPML
jgi:hypothetical protein